MVRRTWPPESDGLALSHSPTVGVTSVPISPAKSGDPDTRAGPEQGDRACRPPLPPMPSAEQAASAPGSHDRRTGRAFPQHSLCSSTRSTRKFHCDAVQDLSSPRGAPPCGCFCQNPSDRNRNLVCVTCFFLSEEIIC